MREATKAVHAGEHRTPNAPISEPIHLSSTYAWEGFDEPNPKWIYSRYGHPNREALENVVAALEGAEHAVAFCSGTAAVAAILGLVDGGGHVLLAEDLYGGSTTLGREVLPRRGIAVGYFDPLDAASIAAAAQTNTKLLLFETPTNPTLRIADIGAVVSSAKSLGIKTALDNTFATPILQQPLKFGVDVVCHSATKYLGGHSDVLGGIAATNDPEIGERLANAAKWEGSMAVPFDSWLVCRGIKSLVPRVRMQCDGAMQVARFLSRHPEVERVNYPGLESHPGHDTAKRQMSAFGGMLSFALKGSAKRAKDFGRHCRIFRMAASLGGVESLISYPPLLSHAALSEEERLARGIPPTLLRISIGLEDPQDLIEDLDLALKGTIEPMPS